MPITLLTYPALCPRVIAGRRHTGPYPELLRGALWVDGQPGGFSAPFYILNTPLYLSFQAVFRRGYSIVCYLFSSEYFTQNEPVIIRAVHRRRHCLD
jgi:hypothetical protein